MMEEKKKALAVVAGPYRFCQILWLYALHPEYRWSILLLPYGKGNDAAQKLEAACRKLGIFEHIFRPQVVGEHSPFGQKLALAAKMCLFYVTGRKKVFMRRMLEKMTDGEKFSVLDWTDVFDGGLDDVGKALWKSLLQQGCVTVKYSDEDSVCFAVTLKGRKVVKPLRDHYFSESTVI